MVVEGLSRREAILGRAATCRVILPESCGIVSRYVEAMIVIESLAPLPYIR